MNPAYNPYLAKDADEELFAQIKVDMDGRRIRTRNEAAAEGKPSQHSLPVSFGLTFCECSQNTRACSKTN
jgi:hypothetical protein